MLKRAITYEDWDGETVTKDFHFNLTKPELIELQVEPKGGLVTFIESIIKSEDEKEIIAIFKKIVLMAYGVREADRFIKNDQVREEFSQTAAFPALFMELASDDEKAADFLLAVIPKDVSEALSKDQLKQAMPRPPTPPTSKE
jgi:hypothetical protein